MPPRFPTIFETLANAFRMPAIVRSKQGGENNYAFPRPATTKHEHFPSLRAR